ncbi:hypothetical protein ACFS7Z_13245 [Pontibacter toksunensis]|uniref:Uncharacterized protein n=1 Tax=Pontibacter toksunensis TaxID=1332631 RepID=A0ABW6BU95_9BACT
MAGATGVTNSEMDFEVKEAFSSFRRDELVAVAGVIRLKAQQDVAFYLYSLVSGY